MRIEFTVRAQHRVSHDVAVTAPTGCTVSDFAARLSALVDGEPDAEVWCGPRRVASTELLGSRGLRTGDIVSLGGPGPRDLSAGAVLRLHVVGGPDAGQIVALPRGTLTIGRDADCDVVLTDPDVSRRHAEITVSAVGTTVRDMHSTNGTSLAGQTVDEDPVALSPGALVRIGDSFLSVSGADQAPASVRASPAGSVLVNRPPRVRTPVGTREVTFPEHGGARTAQRVQWIAALLPALAGGALALAMHSPQFLMFALLSPVIILATALGDRVHWRRSRRHDAISYRHREADARAATVSGLEREVFSRRRAAPDPAVLYTIATVPGAALWERRRSDADALSARIGLADLPSTLVARRGSHAEAAGCVQDVPVALDLRAGPLGIAAPRAIGLGVARWLVSQLAVLHSPADLDIALLLCDGVAASWTWARWLPHVGTRAATTPEDRQSLVNELASLVEKRLAGRRLAPDGWRGPWVLLVVDRAGELNEMPGLASLLAVGSAAGITAICLDEHERGLPASCASSALATGETGSRLQISRGDGAEPVIAVADQVTSRWAGSVARALAPLADPGRDASCALPASCRLIDLLGIEQFDAALLLDRWSRSDGSPSTVLGTGVDGAISIDLIRDGPHALIAGTTGAGKSELLQSLVAGLAANHPPEAVSFVLIDYKGGAAFADCSSLPHTVGMVTDLDAQLTGRVLRSLHCELGRREQLFAVLGAKDLAAYRAAAPPGVTLSRLVLVVDEFAALAEELPEFISGLIAIAQRGRSLGIHLVLATQRPGGVISPEIRANTTLRIALRVSDPAESSDVIGTDRAAHLARATPGRAVVRIAERLVEIQTARIGGPARLGASHDIAVTPLDDWRRPLVPDDDGLAVQSDLQLLVGAARQAAAMLCCASVHRPWLPPLPAQLPARELDAARGTCVTFGLADLPDEQQQLPVRLDLQAGGSVSFTGGPRSGRSNALVTIASIAAQQLTTDELAIYAIDCAGGALNVLAGLAHCATTATRDRFELVETLLRRLEAEITRRQAWLATWGVSSFEQARSAGHLAPAMLCLLDGWEDFVAAAEEHDAGRSTELFVRLLGMGPSVGLTVVLAGDRSTLAARLAGAVATKFVLGLSDRADYALAGITARSVPQNMVPGRAVRAADSVELQLAFLGAEPTRAEQTQTIAAVCAGARHTGTACPASDFEPIRLRPLPARIAIDELAVTPGRFVLGVGGDAAEPMNVDLFAGAGRLLIAGPSRSGRSTALSMLLVQAVRAGIAVIAAAPHRSPLSGVADAHGVCLLRPDAPASAAANLATQPRTLLLVDDSEAFLDTPVGEVLSVTTRTAPVGLCVVVAGSSEELPLTYRGVAAEVRRSRCALILQPGPGDGELVGRRLPHRRALTTAGRGVLIGDSAWGAQFGADPIPIQVALA